MKKLSNSFLDWAAKKLPKDKLSARPEGNRARAMQDFECRDVHGRREILQKWQKHLLSENIRIAREMQSVTQCLLAQESE